MIDNVLIRSAEVGDLPALEALYPKMFPEEDLLPVVRALSALDSGVQSIVAVRDTDIVGHVMFTDCSVAGSTETLSVLGPLGVAPTQQKQGIGSALVQHGFAQLRDANVAAVYVLGDPNYYSRFGFVAENGIQPPYPLPPEWDGAWQSLHFSDVAIPNGTLAVPAPWDERKYWTA